jgi:hypothetical protein
MRVVDVEATPAPPITDVPASFEEAKEAYDATLAQLLREEEQVRALFREEMARIRAARRAALDNLHNSISAMPVADHARTTLARDQIPRLRAALALARERGCSIEYKGGEVVVWSPDRRRHVTHNARRDDASRALIALLRALE